MRELKFRAWSEETKSFEYFDLYAGTECGLTNLQIWARNSPIEQYTGLRDKNGKEIYDGDIVMYDYGFGTYIVTYRRYDASFVLEDDNREEVLNLVLSGHPFYEVIGNIHENPELLEEEE